MVDVADLAGYVGADQNRDASTLQRALDVANALVSDAFANAWKTVPPAVNDEVVLRTAMAIYKTAQTADTGMFGAPDGTPVPGVANDPLRKSWDLIKRYTNRV